MVNEIPYNSVVNEIPYNSVVNEIPYNSVVNEIPYNSVVNEIPYSTSLQVHKVSLGKRNPVMHYYKVIFGKGSFCQFFQYSQ